MYAERNGIQIQPSCLQILTSIPGFITYSSLIPSLSHL